MRWVDAGLGWQGVIGSWDELASPASLVDNADWTVDH